MSWTQTLPELPVIAGLQMVLDPSDETGRWPKRSPRGVVQIDEDTEEPVLIMSYGSPEGPDRLLTIDLPARSRMDLEHQPTFLYALGLLSKLSDTEDAWLAIESATLELAQKAVVEWDDITDNDRLAVARALAERA